MTALGYTDAKRVSGYYGMNIVEYFEQRKRDIDEQLQAIAVVIEQLGPDQIEHLLQSGHIAAAIHCIHKFLSLDAELIEAEFG